MPDRKAVLWCAQWSCSKKKKNVDSCCVTEQSLSFFTEEIRSCPYHFLSLYIRENPLSLKVVDTFTCFVSLEGRTSEELFVFLQISLSLKLSITSWRAFWVFMYNMYIVVHTVCDIFCTGCPWMHSCIRNRDIWHESRCVQPKDCAYVYIHLQYTHGYVCTIRYALLGQTCSMKPQSVVAVVLNENEGVYI